MRSGSKQWCISSGCAHLTRYHRRALIRRGAALCEKHFLPSQFMTPPAGTNAPKQLLWNAVPSVFPLSLKAFGEGKAKPERPHVQQRKLFLNHEEGSLESVTTRKKVDVEDYEMAALPTFRRERLMSIAKKQWHEIKRLRSNVRNLERGVVANVLQDELYLLELLERNLDGPLLDRVSDIIVGDGGESFTDEDT
ncbi:hypothetical protein HPB48_004533 [Haemaphysalis longicornis]|uniref:Uncharacterized protein n=1 Tax=Haemaphysalis longicornis TaxID=44386 RepID=A0A9J6FZ33_HAELO|nr:hypothetical protein HPB48_004533 [Haemaphysalis longicornis]